MADLGKPLRRFRIEPKTIPVPGPLPPMPAPAPAPAPAEPAKTPEKVPA